MIGQDTHTLLGAEGGSSPWSGALGLTDRQTPRPQRHCASKQRQGKQVTLITHLSQTQLGKQYVCPSVKENMIDKSFQCHRDEILWVGGLGWRINAGSKT